MWIKDISETLTKASALVMCKTRGGQCGIASEDQLSVVIAAPSPNTRTRRLFPSATRFHVHVNVFSVLSLSLRHVHTAGDVTSPGALRPLLRQVVEAAAGAGDPATARRPELPDIEYISTGFRDLLKSGFGSVEGASLRTRFHTSSRSARAN